MDNSNMGYKYMEIIFLSLLLQQHKQSQEDVRLWVGVDHISKHVQHASSILGRDSELGNMLVRGHEILKRLRKGKIQSASLISPRILSQLPIHGSILI